MTATHPMAKAVLANKQIFYTPTVFIRQRAFETFQLHFCQSECSGYWCCNVSNKS